MAEAKGEKFAAVRYRWARIFGALRYALFGRIGSASVSVAVGGPSKKPITLEDAREQYAAQLRSEALLKEIEQLRKLLTHLPPPS